MQIGMIGLGRMGGNMARRLTKGGHQCVVFDRNRENVNALAKEGRAPAYSLEELVEKLSAPRALWIMLPSGAPTEETVAALFKPLESGDAIIDGGNSYYVDDIRRAKELAALCFSNFAADTAASTALNFLCLQLGLPAEFPRVKARSSNLCASFCRSPHSSMQTKRLMRS